MIQLIISSLIIFFIGYMYEKFAQEKKSTKIAFAYFFFSLEMTILNTCFPDSMTMRNFLFSIPISIAGAVFVSAIYYLDTKRRYKVKK